MSAALNKRVNCRNYDSNFASRLKVPLSSFGSSFTVTTSNNVANKCSAGDFVTIFVVEFISK